MIDAIYFDENIYEKIEFAKILGYDELILIFKHFQFNEINKTIQEFQKQFKINFYSCILVENLKDLKKVSNVKAHKQFDLLFVNGLNLKLNREAVENVFVDGLVNPQQNREDSGFNHIFAKKALKNDVALIINFSQILENENLKLTREIEKLIELLKVARKYKLKVAIFSFAKSKYDLKDPLIFSSFLYTLGYELKDAKNVVKKSIKDIIEENRKKRSEKWIFPGVEII